MWRGAACSGLGPHWSSEDRDRPETDSGHEVLLVVCGARSDPWCVVMAAFEGGLSFSERIQLLSCSMTQPRCDAA